MTKAEHRCADQILKATFDKWKCDISNFYRDRRSELCTCGFQWRTSEFPMIRVIPCSEDAPPAITSQRGRECHAGSFRNRVDERCVWVSPRFNLFPVTYAKNALRVFDDLREISKDGWGLVFSTQWTFLTKICSKTCLDELSFSLRVIIWDFV